MPRPKTRETLKRGIPLNWKEGKKNLLLSILVALTVIINLNLGDTCLFLLI